MASKRPATVVKPLDTVVTGDSDVMVVIKRDGNWRPTNADLRGLVNGEEDPSTAGLGNTSARRGNKSEFY